MHVLMHFNGKNSPNTGIGRVISGYGEKLEKEGNKVEYLFGYDGYLSRLKGKLHILHHSPITALLFASWIWDKNFDTIISHTPETAFDAVWAKRLLGKKYKVITHCHGLDKVIREEWKTEVKNGKTKYDLITDLYLRASIFKGWFGIRWADEVSTVSRIVQGEVKQFYGRESRVVSNDSVINFSHFVKFDKLKARAEFGFKPSEKVILFVGSPAWRKGLPYLLEAFELLPDKFILQIVGCSAVPSSRIHVSEWVGTEKLCKFYSAADFLVVPSIVEPYGLVFLEAKFFGLPAVGCSGTGAEEIKGVKLVSKRNSLELASFFVK